MGILKYTNMTRMAPTYDALLTDTNTDFSLLGINMLSESLSDDINILKGVLQTIWEFKPQNYYCVGVYTSGV